MYSSPELFLPPFLSTMNIISLSIVAAMARASTLVDTVLETADLLASRKQTREPRIVVTSRIRINNGPACDRQNRQRADCQILARFLQLQFGSGPACSYPEPKCTVKKGVRDTKAEYPILRKKTRNVVRLRRVRHREKNE